MPSKTNCDGIIITLTGDLLHGLIWGWIPGGTDPRTTKIHEVAELKKANAALMAGFGPVALEAADIEIDRLTLEIERLRAILRRFLDGDEPSKEDIRSILDQ
jgi:hypothetical protein